MQWGESWSPEQETLADIVVRAWLQYERWPIFEYVAAEMENVGLDALAVLQSFPILGERSPTTRWYSDVRFDRAAPTPPENSEVQLTAGGLARHEHGVEMAQAFVAALAFAADLHRRTPIDPNKLADVTLSSGDLERVPSIWWPKHALRAAGALLRSEWPPGLVSWSEGDEPGSWRISVGRNIRRYKELTVERYLWLIKRDIDDSMRVPTESAAEPATPSGSAPTIVRRMKPDKAIEELRKLRADAETDEVRRSGPSHDAWKAKVRVIMQRALGPEATVLKSFENVGYFIGIYSGAPGEEERDRAYFAGQVSVAAAFIDAAIFELELDLDPEATTIDAADAKRAGTIFLVHGHDEGLKAQVQHLLERVTGAEVVVLHQQADAGRTIIEKFVAHAQQSMFAVIILTPDDEGRVVGAANWRPRARQNVVLEHGYFIGRLGRSRVVALHTGNLELPSDLSGVIYKPLDPGGAWKFELAKELRAAGIEIDMNKVV